MTTYENVDAATLADYAMKCSEFHHKHMLYGKSDNEQIFGRWIVHVHSFVIPNYQRDFRCKIPAYGLSRIALEEATVRILKAHYEKLAKEG